MANVKSAVKRMKQSEKRRLLNRKVKTRIKTAVNRFLMSLDHGDTQEAQREFNTVTRVIDKAATKGVLHKKTAARKKSRLARRFKEMAS